jgi:hypothetical protein
MFNLASSLHDNIGLLRCTQTFSSHFILMSTSPHTSERGPTSTRRPAIISRGKTRCDRELVQQPLVRWVEVERAVLNFVSGVGVLTMAGWSFFLGAMASRFLAAPPARDRLVLHEGPGLLNGSWTQDGCLAGALSIHLML